MAYAEYEGLPNNGMYPVYWRGGEPSLSLGYGDHADFYQLGKETNSDLYFIDSLPSVSGFRFMEFRLDHGFIDFNYAPDLYDYYLLCTVAYPNGNFRPQVGLSALMSTDINYSNSVYNPFVDDFYVYDHTDSDSRGFTVFAKFPNISVSNNTSLIGIALTSADNNTFIDAGVFYFDGLIIAVDKSVSSTSDALAEIILRLDDIDSDLVSGAAGIQSAIDTQMQHDQQLWDDTYNPDSDQAASDTDSVISDYESQLADSLGLFDYVSSVTTDFVSMFSDSPGDPVLTFPAWAITVSGISYPVWSAYTVNLSELLSDFSDLITVVRFALVFVVWAAVIRYLWSVWDKIFGGGSS